MVNGTAAGPNTAGDTYNYLSHVVDIDATQYTAVALRANGTVFAWGYSADGQTGDGYNQAYVQAPTQVRGGASTGKSNTFTSVGNNYATQEFLYRAVDAAVGGDHIAILTDGYDGAGRNYSVYSAGANASGQLGQDPAALAASNVPVLSVDAVTLNANASSTGHERPVQVAAGLSHSAFRTVDMNDRVNFDNSAWRGYVWSFGNGDMGQMGDNTRQSVNFAATKVVKGGYRSTEAQIDYLEGVIDLSGGYNHSAAISTYYKNGTGANAADIDASHLDGMFGYVWNWGINTHAPTDACGAATHTASVCWATCLTTGSTTPSRRAAGRA